MQLSENFLQVVTWLYFKAFTETAAPPGAEFHSRSTRTGAVGRAHPTSPSWAGSPLPPPLRAQPHRPCWHLPESQFWDLLFFPGLDLLPLEITVSSGQPISLLHSWHQSLLARLRANRPSMASPGPTFGIQLTAGDSYLAQLVRTPSPPPRGGPLQKGVVRSLILL